MKQKTTLLQKAVRKHARANTLIRETTDDQLTLALAADALDQAELDLRSAIEYANATQTITTAEHIALRLRLIAIVTLNKCLAILRFLPPQTLVFPLFATQLTLLLTGPAWLLFGLHIPYWYVMPLIIVQLVSFEFVLRIPDKLVIWLLDEASKFAQAAEHDCSAIIQLSTTHLIPRN